MKSFVAHNVLAILTVVLVFTGCKQPETIIVDESPTAAAPSDTTAIDTQPAGNEASFRKLVIGEYNTIPTLDPLFAEHASAMRAVQLVFEGLVRLDASDNLAPGMAESWEVSSDSMRYTFTLRDEIFYHDSDVFSTGTGRRLTSLDVKAVFERMAKANVPPKAAHLFMEIKGFDPYFQEQREVYLPANRKLSGVSGIKTPDDNTVVFELANQDSNFLKKLATPLAVIYPQEAVGRSTDSFSPVGTGPFRFSSRDTDSTIVFSKFKDYYAASTIKLNRVDIVSSNSESKLFRSVSQGNIYVMPQLGPQTMPVLLNGDSLQTSYADRYRFKSNAGHKEVVMRYNPGANLSSEAAQTLSNVASLNASDYFNRFPNSFVTPQAGSASSSDTSFANGISQVFAAFSENPFVKSYLGNLSNVLDSKGVQIKMAEIRTPSRNTALFFTENYPLIPDTKWDNYQELFRFRIKQAALQRKEITGLNFNSYPWWLDLRGVSIPPVENLN